MSHNSVNSMDFSLVKKIMLTTRLHRQIVNRLGLIVLTLAFLVVVSCVGLMHWLYTSGDEAQVHAELTKVEDRKSTRLNSSHT